MDWIKGTLWPWMRSVWKAIGAGVTAAFLYVMAAGIFTLDQTPVEALWSAWQTIGDWTTGQWFGLIAAILAAYGVVWAVPNVSRANVPR